MSFDIIPVRIHTEELKKFFPLLINTIPEEIGKCETNEIQIERLYLEDELSILYKEEIGQWAGINKMLGINIELSKYPTQDFVATIKAAL